MFFFFLFFKFIISVHKSPRSLRSRYVDINIELPETYNFLEEFSHCNFGPINQECGCCYAYGPLKAMSHRICRATGKPIFLSAQYIVACDLLDLGCDGGCARSTFYFLEQHGVTDTTCHPWQNVTRFSPDFCSKCQNPNISKEKQPNIHLYRSVYGSLRQLTTPDEIKKEIYIKGPVVASVATDDKMRYYRNGIYTRPHLNFSVPVAHTLEIIGWGKENDIEYWIGYNSYGYDWGNNGVINIRMGHNDAFIESFVYAADPDIVI